jgi:hypothetical protein
MNRTTTKSLLAIAGAAAMSATTALAVPTTVSGFDTPGCDVLAVPTNVDELGTQVFPANETILSAFVGTTPLPACPSSDTAAPNFIVEITNMTGIAWPQVWYVGNPGTTLSNEDGVIAGQHVFLINSVSSDFNNPLTFESMIPDNIFQPGEIWRFTIDDYFNSSGLAPHLFGQIGVPDTFPVPPTQSGNIIAGGIVPEPSSVGVIVIGASMLLARRRR